MCIFLLNICFFCIPLFWRQNANRQMWSFLIPQPFGQPHSTFEGWQCVYVCVHVSMQVRVWTGLLLLHGVVPHSPSHRVCTKGRFIPFPGCCEAAGVGGCKTEWWQAQYSISQTSTSKYISTLLKSSLPWWKTNQLTWKWQFLVESPWMFFEVHHWPQSLLQWV